MAKTVQKAMTQTLGDTTATTTTVLKDNGCNMIPANGPFGNRTIGPRTVIVPADPIIWDEGSSYEYLTLVASEDFGQSYISKKDVPAGTQLTNTEYWIPAAMFNAQLAAIMAQLAYVRGVPNQAAVKNVPQEDGYIMCLGYANAGDGGGCLFSVESAEPDGYYSVAMNNGKYAVYRDASANLSVMGVVPGADVASSFETALGYSAYKEFVLPAGEYLVSSTIHVKQNNVVVRGLAGIAPTSGADKPSGCALIWNGAVDPSSAVLLISPTGSYAVDTEFPARGVEIRNISIDGNNAAGYGIYTPFMAYSGTLDRVYAQRCVVAGVCVASAWMVDFGEILCWYNAIGILIGVDYQAATHQIYQCNFRMLNGHNSSQIVSVPAFSEYIGTGIVAAYLGAVNILNMDAERNQTGAIIKSNYNVFIESAWVESNKTGAGLKTSGSVKVGTLLVSNKDTIRNTGTLVIGCLSSEAAYYPFEGSTPNSVTVGVCSYTLYKGQDLKTWKALTTEVSEWCRFNNLNSTTHNYNNIFTVPSPGISMALVIYARNTANCEQFSIADNHGNSLAIPARQWTEGEAVVFDWFTYDLDYTQPITLSQSSVSTTKLEYDLSICSLKYFHEMPYMRYRPTSL